MNLQCVTTPGRLGLGWQDTRPSPQQVLTPGMVSEWGSEDGGTDMMSVCCMRYQVLGNEREEVFDNFRFLFSHV
jgi:hypothetical protein